MVSACYFPLKGTNTLWKVADTRSGVENIQDDPRVSYLKIIEANLMGLLWA